MPITIPHRSKHFTLYISAGKNSADIKMQMITPIINTSHMPDTLIFLDNNLPGILRNKCFNDKNLPFHIEVKKTEIGHLFEHMILEFLCREKNRLGEINSVFNGITRWNWEKETRGTFHISIDAGFKEKKVLYSALLQSVHLLNDLIDSFMISQRAAYSRLPAQSKRRHFLTR